jgi:hypothetical protein
MTYFRGEKLGKVRVAFLFLLFSQILSAYDAAFSGKYL